MATSERKRYLLSGEAVAVGPGTVRRDADGFYWLVGEPTPQSMRHPLYGDVAVVHVRGSLEHHLTAGADSYEGILDKLEKAKAGLDGDEPKEPPSAVIQCIDSRGGVVAGLNQSVATMQRMFPRTGIPLISYINEMAASAAYAWACGGHEIIGPESMIGGSIGTISTMFSVAKQDEMMGVDVRLLTSGARKSDGHPHAAISDAAEAAELDRVEDLAISFMKLVSAARGIPVQKIEKMQAGIFLGPKAKAAGLVDSLLSLDDVARALSRQRSGIQAKGNETTRRAGA